MSAPTRYRSSQRRFPVAVLRVKVPPAILEEITTHTDTLLANNDPRWDYSRQLAGRIVHGAQIQIPPLDAEAGDRWQRELLFGYLLLMSQVYLQEAAKNGLARHYWKTHEVEIDDAWCVSQLAGDFNPLHGHDGLLSGVLYLKVPDQISSGCETGGYLQFRHSNPLTESFFPAVMQEHLFDFVSAEVTPTTDPVSFESREVKPVVGECWIFPSWLLHEVGAFVGTGERRSLAFNVRWCEKSGAVACNSRENLAAVKDQLLLTGTSWERLILFQPDSKCDHELEHSA